jgi:hypothetical protein
MKVQISVTAIGFGVTFFMVLGGLAVYRLMNAAGC